MKIVITFLILMSTLSIFGASKGANSPMVIGIIKEVQSDNIVVVTRDKFTRKLLLNDKSKISYVGFDGAKKETKKSFCIRASVKNEVIGYIYVTPGIGEDPVYPTPEMVKMTPKELFQVADLNQNGHVCYVEASKTIKHSLKHGPVSFSKTDRDRSGAQVQSEGGYRNYYAQPERGSLQGGGTPGGLGMEHEFFESILVPQVMLYGFLGFEPTPDGIRLQPRLPRDWPELTVTRIHFRDHVFDLRVDETNVDVTFRRKGAGPVEHRTPRRRPAGHSISSSD